MDDSTVLMNINASSPLVANPDLGGFSADRFALLYIRALVGQRCSLDPVHLTPHKPLIDFELHSWSSGRQLKLGECVLFS